MASIWFKSQLAGEIMKNKSIFDETPNIIADITSNRIDITQIVENMAGVLTNKDAENREHGMRFFTNLLSNLPKHYLNEIQVKFISKFYVDRLKDNHRVIPAVLEGYLAIIDMKNYKAEWSGEFFTLLFREVPCQQQLRQERYHIYLILQKLLDRDAEYMKTLGPDFVYGVISSIDGERDPRNLIFLFKFLPQLISLIPLGHLVEEMFDLISCYYPIDFHPSPDDPAAVSRQDLANALCPCLCAIPEFAEHCLVLLVEKLDSSLRVAKIDSLCLLAESCKTFKAESYTPFLKTLWASIHREISHKTDDELKMAAHEALSALVRKLSTTANTDQTFENFVKAILITMQTSIAESSTAAQFFLASKILLTVANASKESCIIITKSMIPAIIAYYEFKTSAKLQIASLEFLALLYQLATHWKVVDEIVNQAREIPQLCLTAVSQTNKEYQISGLKTLIKVKDALETDLVLPFIEVLMYNIQHSQDNDLLKVSVETVHAMAQKYPELIMDLVVKGKCGIDNICEDKVALQQRLQLLSSLASVDQYTKLIIEEMLKLVNTGNEEASKVVEALNESMSDVSLYSSEKLTQIESDHGLVDSVLMWLYKQIAVTNQMELSHGYTLVANTISSLPPEKQLKILSNHTKEVLTKCKTEEIYFVILESLYTAICRDVFSEYHGDIMSVALELSLKSENDMIRGKACALLAHFLNKADNGQRFEMLYELLTNYLSSCSRDDQGICPSLIILFGWIAKALILRGSDKFQFWLGKIMVALSSPDYCQSGAEAIKLITTDFPNYLTARQHCRVSLLYKQRMFQTFSNIAVKQDSLNADVKEKYLLSWAYVLQNAPKSTLSSQVEKLMPLIIDSLEHNEKDLLTVMVDVLSYFVQAKLALVADSLQTIIPRLNKLTKYNKSMDVRIKSLECMYEIANTYPTAVLLPYKQDVLFELAGTLDDKKRLVRNVAVKARTRWFLVGAPGESKEN